VGLPFTEGKGDRLSIGGVPGEILEKRKTILQVSKSYRAKSKKAQQQKKEGEVIKCPKNGNKEPGKQKGQGERRLGWKKKKGVGKEIGNPEKKTPE